jgi:hypothetical protein
LHRENCEHYGEGKIGLGVELGQMKVRAYGNVKRKIPTNYTALDLTMLIDFFIAPEIIGIMAHDLDSFPGKGPIDLSRLSFKKNMAEILGPEQANAMFDELALFGKLKEPVEQLNRTIVLGELKLEWNDESNSYRSVGDLGIMSVNGVQINKQFKGYVEVSRKRSGDLFDIYIEVTPNIYYYFGYSRGVMQTLSTSRVFIQTIMGLKTKQRKSKTPKNGTPYVYIVSSDRKMQMFKRRFENNEVNEAEEPLLP